MIFVKIYMLLLYIHKHKFCLSVFSFLYERFFLLHPLDTHIQRDRYMNTCDNERILNWREEEKKLNEIIFFIVCVFCCNDLFRHLVFIYYSHLSQKEGLAMTHGVHSHLKDIISE